MSEPKMIDLAFSTRRFQIPAPERITDASVAAAARKMVEVRAAMDDANRARNDADGQVTALRNLNGGNLSESLLADPFQQLDGPNDELEAAERAARDAQTRLAALDGAAGLAVNGYTAAVDHARASWQRTLVGKVPASLTKITTAVRLLDEARAALAETLDMAEGLAQGAYSAKLSGPGSYVVALSQAIEAGTQALSAATSQADAIKPAKAAAS